MNALPHRPVVQTLENELEKIASIAMVCTGPPAQQKPTEPCRGCANAPPSVSAKASFAVGSSASATLAVQDPIKFLGLLCALQTAAPTHQYSAQSADRDSEPRTDAVVLE